MNEVHWQDKLTNYDSYYCAVGIEDPKTSKQWHQDIMCVSHLICQVVKDSKLNSWLRNNLISIFGAFLDNCSQSGNHNMIPFVYDFILY